MEPVEESGMLHKTQKHDLPQDEEGQLTIDVWQTPEEIMVQAIVGGVRLDDLDVEVTHDMVTLRGKRERQKEISGNDYFYQELYWGAFSRSILLPQEVDSDEAEATMKNGLLTIKLPKLDKARISKLKVKNE
ncbi:MAG: Protein containing Heat shock protein Hsp20 protein [Candidatus Giovannonibacteria bacterium GW2011_GWA1_43_15]|uniref:Protein containing Heat shock protein Hsp20 protein n=1 Tax=Candidatus Giovannonibacteria bacterium GW2011_GWA2_44_26 TaxID=1618648 RepID=A0A0G1IXV4_9BACT|nr:MAG: Protein containing Heat shock protein Hsp20 protein [Candidatus Giovannonibacteria bacterium GW2011_GWB1_43_13]KKS99748.1 MAG: Protein containing Heat shock protein Hsp20 protein [Candidatus Giovannonibacteria bacterium GW2011_GWA1_43_15]KKT21163.1 MAG: Protein containing Heat shock protein Hsp20 protein [Candidatus Giovannonibacteria bacterium GW2011_GWC2_43_8]KKT63833.1 MAG: Protein containing Heat shock protein Hsp20 protein [Candidatus Giovannonibacteria bacterium GW2011_GWA2_44_26]